MVNGCRVHRLSFHGAADNTGNIVFLHADKEQHNRDRNDHSTGTEDSVVFVDIGSVHHGIQTFGNGEVAVIILHNDGNEDIVYDWIDKSGEYIQI